MEQSDILIETRKVLRLTDTTFDSQIMILIDACKQDLKLAGVLNVDETDPLIMRAIFLYARANFGLGDENGRQQRLYDAQKLALRESGDYNV